DEGATGTPACACPRHSGGSGNVFERSVAEVVIQAVASVVGDEQIFPAVIVVVPDADALAPSGGSQPRFHGDIGKSTVVIVAKKVIGGFLALRKSFQSSAVDDENIGPAVVVVIEDGDTGAG